MEEIKNSNIHITSRVEIDHLHLHPNKHLVLQALKKYNPEFEPEFFSLSDFTSKRILFITLYEIQVFKSEFHCDLAYRRAYQDDEKSIKDFFLELYLVYRNQDDSEPLILNLDDLLFYLNQVQNQFRRKEEKFPELQLSFAKNGWYNFSTKVVTMCNNYFPIYNGTVLYFEFDNELNELYAILSNNVAFLYRYKQRVFEEIEVKDNYI